MAWCIWHSCWCKERNRALCPGNWLLSPLSATTLPVHTNSYSKVKNDYCGCTHTGKTALSLCVLHFSSPAENAVLLMQQQPPLLSWHQPTEKSSIQNDQERSQILRKYSFPFAWGFAAIYQWLGYGIVSLDFSLSFKERCFQFDFLTQWSAKPPTPMPRTGVILPQLFPCAHIQIDVETHRLWLCSKFKPNLK